ncbi:MAG TPA: DUF998 domain-containing protein [Chitinophagaceae bacterium]|nr:DUF998 domain-containing protein [Chitinophagaceae bacterium]
MNNKFLLRCGIFSSLLYIAMNAFIPLLDSNYRVASQTVSELSAVDASTRNIWVWLAMLYTLLMGAFGWGIIKASEGNRFIRMAGILVIAHAVVDLGWPFAPMHLREVLAAGGSTFSDTMHLVIAGITVVLMIGIISFGAAAMGMRFRIYSVITLLLLAGFGLLTGLEAPAVEKNLPAPWVGIWERINIGVFMIWVIVFAIALSARQKKTTRKP